MSGLQIAVVQTHECRDGSSKYFMYELRVVTSEHSYQGILKRWSDMHLLRTKLGAEFGTAMKLPTLKESSPLLPGKVKRRAKAIERYLNQCAALDGVGKSPVLLHFVGAPQLGSKGNVVLSGKNKGAKTNMQPKRGASDGPAPPRRRPILDKLISDHEQYETDNGIAGTRLSGSAPPALPQGERPISPGQKSKMQKAAYRQSHAVTAVQKYDAIDELEHEVLFEARVLYDFEGESEKEATIRAGDIVYVATAFAEDDGWWSGTVDRTMEYGYVPEGYLEPLD